MKAMYLKAPLQFELRDVPLRTPENGEVSLIVECEKLEEHYLRDRIIVKDTGCGMSPEFLRKMYEPLANNI